MIEYNRDMAKRVDISLDECLEMLVSPQQKDVFIIVDEWWKRFGYSPTLREICEQRNSNSLGSTKRMIDKMVDLGILKRMKNKGRSIRPVYINFRNIE